MRKGLKGKIGEKNILTGDVDRARIGDVICFAYRGEPVDPHTGPTAYSYIGTVVENWGMVLAVPREGGRASLFRAEELRYMQNKLLRLREYHEWLPENMHPTIKALINFAKEQRRVRNKKSD